MKIETMFVTKYALTDGIVERKGHRSETATGSRTGTIEYFTNKREGFHFFFKIGKDCFATKPEAEERARDMARRKIKSLKKQLIELETLAKTPKWSSKK